MNKHLTDWEWLLRDLDSIVGVMSRISWLRKFTDLIRQDERQKIKRKISKLQIYEAGNGIRSYEEDDVLKLVSPKNDS